VPPKKRNLRAVNPKQRTAPRATIAQTIAKGDQIFQLVASGLTITEAGQQMQPRMSQPQASKLWAEACARAAEQNSGLRQQMLERELETLRLLKRAFMPLALRGQVDAARVVLQVVDKVSDIAGLNTALKVQISNQRVDETVSKLTAMLEDNADQIPQLIDSGVLVFGTYDDPSNDPDGAESDSDDQAAG
jgi:hypothetical protein